MASKYGRLFTEADVLAMLIEATCDAMIGPAGQTAGAIADRVIATFPATFPADEPLFLLRGQDANALSAVDEYERNLNCFATLTTSSRTKVAAARAAMEQWQADNPDRVKVPD